MSYTYKIKYGTITINASEGDNSSFSAPANKIYNLNTSNQFNSIGNGGTIYYRCNNGLIELSKDGTTRVNANQTSEQGGTEHKDTQGPCLNGYHIPTKDEWITLVNAMFELGIETEYGDCMITYMKMPFAGYRDRSSANVSTQGDYANYWSSTAYNTDSAYCIFGLSSWLDTESTSSRSFGQSIRPFKDEPVIPTGSGWTQLITEPLPFDYGIYHNASLGLISIVYSGGVITIADKNLGATTVYNDGDTLNQSNCGNYYQWGNNYGFPQTGAVTTSSTQVDASNYGPGNYYYSDRFITVSAYPWDWSSVQNDNLWGGETNGTWADAIITAHIGLADYNYGTGANNGGTSVNNSDQYFSYANNLTLGNTNSGTPLYQKTDSSLLVRGGGGAGDGGAGSYRDGGDGTLVTVYPTANTKMGVGGNGGTHNVNALGTTDTPGDTGIGYGGGGGGAWDTEHMSAGNKGIVCVSYNVDGSDGIDFNNTFGGQKIIKGGKVYHLFSNSGALNIYEGITAQMRLDQATLSETKSVTTGYMGGFMTEDGTMFFATDEVNHKILKHILSTPFDITTMGSAVQEITGQSTPHQVYLSPDGTKLFVANYGNNRMVQYNLSTPFDLSTATLYHSLQYTSPTAVMFSRDGTHMYWSSNNANIIHCTLSTPYDINTASQIGSFSVSGDCRGIAISSDGHTLFRAGGATVYQYNLPTAYSLDGITQQYTRGGFTTAVNGNITPDGKYLYITDRLSSGGYVYRLDMPLQGQWVPSNDTQVYMPLNSSTQYSDMSGKNRGIDSYANVSFGTYQGVDCAYFNGGHINLTPFATSNNNTTFCCWLYCTSVNTGDGKIFDMRTFGSSGNQIVYCYQNGKGYGFYGVGGEVFDMTDRYNQWICYCAVFNAPHNLTIYLKGNGVDRTLTYTETTGLVGTPGYCNIGNEFNNASSTPRYFNGYMSRLIYEHKPWSLQDFNDYYAITKSNYGIS